MKELWREGEWRGEGKLTLSCFEEELPFQATFKTDTPIGDSDEVLAHIRFGVDGYTHELHHEYVFSHFFRNFFQVEFHQDSWGVVLGKGVYENDFFGIEYNQNNLGFTGFESFQFNQDGSLNLQAEYVTHESLRSSFNVKLQQVLAAAELPV